MMKQPKGLDMYENDPENAQVFAEKIAKFMKKWVT
jgi:hypothetical protein